MFCIDFVLVGLSDVNLLQLLQTVAYEATAMRPLFLTNNYAINSSQIKIPENLDSLLPDQRCLYLGQAGKSRFYPDYSFDVFYDQIYGAIKKDDVPNVDFETSQCVEDLASLLLQKNENPTPYTLQAWGPPPGMSGFEGKLDDFSTRGSIGLPDLNSGNEFSPGNEAICNSAKLSPSTPIDSTYCTAVYDLGIVAGALEVQPANF